MSKAPAQDRDRPTQETALDGRRSIREARQLTRAARRGLAGPQRPYPFAEKIRHAFGAHAPEGLRAHIGGAAAQAGAALSASAYVLDGRAAFARGPDLRTAAHEAFHLYEQSRTRPAGSGVGVRGDGSEVLADKVADAVVAGRSAEPLLAQAPSAPPALQMFNTITSPDAPMVETPWKEIADQLDMETGDVEAKIALMNKGASKSRYSQMIGALGDNCRRAGKVTVSIDGQRDGGPRGNDPIQTAYGALGSLEADLTGTATPLKHDFEGGHLISDEILGIKSYVESNFAPQRRHLNSPVYRKIEEIGAFGIKKANHGVLTPEPADYAMEVEVSYPSPTYKVTTASLQTLLGIGDIEIGKSPIPTDVTLSSRVPGKWTAKVDSGHADYVFRHESTLDASDGAYAGWKANEQAVRDQFANTTSYLDATYWSMDTMNATPMAKPTGVGTGFRSSHTFTAVQAVPRGQTGFAGAPVSTLPAPTPFVVPSLKRSHSYSELPDKNMQPQKRKKKINELAKTIVEENEGDADFEELTVASVERTIEAFTMLRGRSGLKKSDVIKYRPSKSRRSKPKSTVAKATNMRDAFSTQVMLGNFTDKKNTMGF